MAGEKMNTETAVITGKRERVNFWAPSELIKRANRVAKAFNFSLSEVTRKALEEYIEKVEQERLEKEIGEACKYYYELDKEMAKEWESAEARIS
jgi:predicted adenine nucleotide alpha hydrolase (AANH) superfamily ATPase